MTGKSIEAVERELHNYRMMRKLLSEQRDASKDDDKRSRLHIEINVLRRLINRRARKLRNMKKAATGEGATND